MGKTDYLLQRRMDNPMSTEGMDQFLHATKAGALAQAIELATKSDRLGHRDERSRNRMRTPQARVVALWRLLLWPAWAFGVILYAFVVGLDLFSD